MSCIFNGRRVLFLALVGGLFLLPGLQGADTDPKADPDKPEPKPVAPKTPPASKPKPLPMAAAKGLAFLAAHQQPNGGWGAGEGHGLDRFLLPGLDPAPKKAPPAKGAKGPPKDGAVRTDLGNTCIAGLAFLRAGYDARKGTYARNLQKAAEYVCSHVENSDQESMSASDVTGTQLQFKIGAYVDTFLAGWFLAELKGKMPDDKSEKRVGDALNKIMAKMQINQQPDGTWTDNNRRAWAPILSQALASKAANRARQVGAKVDDTMLQRLAQHAQEAFEKANPDLVAKAAQQPPAKGDKAPVKGTPPKTTPKGPRIGVREGPDPDLLAGAAGVTLYSVAAQISGLHSNYQTNKILGESARFVLSSPNATEQEREEAKMMVKRMTDSEKLLALAGTAIAKKVTDQRFIAGFGSDGGEEFISFALIGEMLRSTGSKEWPNWDRSMNDRLTRSQNRDGSWSGHHCITGQTFVTATAVLNLLTDRLPGSGGTSVAGR
jgi:hypothetical protein